MNRRRILRATSLVTLPALISLSCISDRNGDGVTGPPDTSGCPVIGSLPITEGDHALVLIRNFAFIDGDVQIAAGGTVTWLNCELQENVFELHTSTSEDADGQWNSPLLEIGQHYSQRFNTPGEFDYFCAPHPFMTGRVLVQ